MGYPGCHKQLPEMAMVYTTHQNGDDLGMVYGIGFTTLCDICHLLGKPNLWWLLHVTTISHFFVERDPWVNWEHRNT